MSSSINFCKVAVAPLPKQELPSRKRNVEASGDVLKTDTNKVRLPHKQHIKNS